MKFTFQYGQIRNTDTFKVSANKILVYIPVWLDQKPDRQYTERERFNEFTFQYGQIRNNIASATIAMIRHGLHSSMVRLETQRFTFQYGQIRNQKYLQLQHARDKSLHSSMVRLETLFRGLCIIKCLKFTFQYGQIRNFLLMLTLSVLTLVYIPVWLDQKLRVMLLFSVLNICLHSSMVRLETREQLYPRRQENPVYIPVWLDQKRLKLLRHAQDNEAFTFQYGQIRNYLFTCKNDDVAKVYIPVWLDQKRILIKCIIIKNISLHSSMVRLETPTDARLQIPERMFTFQYGQIRNLNQKNILIINLIVYIPVWLDQKPITVLTVPAIMMRLHSSMVRLETFSTNNETIV